MYDILINMHNILCFNNETSLPPSAPPKAAAKLICHPSSLKPQSQSQSQSQTSNLNLNLKPQSQTSTLTLHSQF